MLEEDDVVVSYKSHSQAGYGRKLPLRIKPKFNKKRAMLEKNFNPAYLFLLYPEVADTDVTLMTSTNAHLYFRSCFLAYIVLGDHSLTFSPKYHQKIYADAKNRPSALFAKKLPSLIEKHQGYAKRWAQKRRIGTGRGGVPIYEYIFYNQTPLEFFEELTTIIENLECE